MALQGPSGSGKTMSALLAAVGLCKDWSKVAVIDTENHSAELYSDIGQYNVINIGAPYNPEKYIEAIQLCEKSKIDVIIIDSISHEWEGSGGIIDIHSNMIGNSFTNWGKLTPRHNAFIQAILQSPCHIIGTIRTKQDYVLSEKNGKMVPEKVGLKGITRDGMDYEFTIVLDVDMKHNAVASKDRTGLFSGKPEFMINVETGKTIAHWCNISHALRGEIITESNPNIIERIYACSSVQELLDLFKQQQPNIREEFAKNFTERRSQLAQPISSLTKLSNNGIHTNNSTGT